MGDEASDTSHPKAPERENPHSPLLPPPIRSLLLTLHTLGPLILLVGLLSFLFYPDFVANNTYMSEHALLPGSATSAFGPQDVKWVVQKEKELGRLEGKSWQGEEGGEEWVDERERLKFVMEVLEESGMEGFSYYLSGGKGEREGERGSSLALGVVRGKKGYGTESIVLVAPFDFRGEEGGQKKGKKAFVTNSFLFSVSILRNLVTANWVNKDILLLIPDIHTEEHQLSLFFESYHSLTHSFPPAHLTSFPLTLNTPPPSFSQDEKEENNGFGQIFGEKLNKRRKESEERRGVLPFVGRLRTGLRVVFDGEGEGKGGEKRVGWGEGEGEAPFLLFQNVDGRLANLDLLNTINRIARRERFYFSFPQSLPLDAPPSLSPSPLSSSIHFLSNLPQDLGLKSTPQRITTYIYEMIIQAFGAPSSPHFLFSSWRVEGVGVVLPGGRGEKEVGRYGRVIEGYIRSANNLIETLHQSFYQYLLPDTVTYTSIGQYMISFASIALPLAVLLVYSVYVLNIPSSVSGPLWVQIVFGELCGVLCLGALPYVFEEGGVIYVAAASFILFLFSFIVSPLFSSLFFSPPPQIPKDDELFAYKWTGLTISSVLLGALSILNFSQSVWWASILVLHASLPSIPLNSFFRKFIYALFLSLLSPPILLLLWSFLLGVEEISFAQALIFDFLRHSSLLLPSFFTIYVPFHVHLWRYFWKSF